MKKRFTLYGIGFFFGLVLVFYFLGGKKASCNWLPNDRILNIIQRKSIRISPEVRNVMNEKRIDSMELMKIIKFGDIDFSKSQVKNEPCRNYFIQGVSEQKNMTINVELCDSIATINKINMADHR